VIIRKKSYANRSEEGADMQAVLMSIFRTLTRVCQFQGNVG